jgi:hypothetical protein
MALAIARQRVERAQVPADAGHEDLEVFRVVLVDSIRTARALRKAAAPPDHAEFKCAEYNWSQELGKVRVRIHRLRARGEAPPAPKQQRVDKPRPPPPEEESEPEPEAPDAPESHLARVDALGAAIAAVDRSRRAYRDAPMYIQRLEAHQTQLAAGIKVARRLLKDLPRLHEAAVTNSDRGAVRSALDTWLREANSVRVQLCRRRQANDSTPDVPMRAAAPAEVRRERRKVQKRRERAPTERLAAVEVPLARQDAEISGHRPLKRRQKIYARYLQS